MILFSILIIIIICIVFWIFNQPLVYLDVEFDFFDKFLFVLLYRGFSENSFYYNGVINIRSVDKKKIVYISKYKERGIVGLKLLIWYSYDLEKKLNSLTDYIKKLNTEYLIKEESNQRIIEINLKRDFDACKELLKFLWENVFDFQEKRVDVNFQDVCREPGKIINFKDKSDLEKQGIDIDIPMTKWDWLMGKLGIKKFSIK